MGFGEDQLPVQLKRELAGEGNGAPEGEVCLVRTSVAEDALGCSGYGGRLERMAVGTTMPQTAVAAVGR